MSDALQSLRPPAANKIKKTRTPGIIFVVLLHIVFIWALATGLASSTIELLRGDLEAAVIADEVVEDAAPPPPPPDFEPPPPVVPPPSVIIDLAPAVTQTTAIQQVVDRVAPPAPAAPPPPPIVPASARGNQNVVTANDYPTISRRLREQGRAMLSVCLDETGRVTDVTLLESSGSDRLDDASENLIRRKFRFNPATQGGEPVAGCMQQIVGWQLQ